MRVCCFSSWTTGRKQRFCCVAFNKQRGASGDNGIVVVSAGFLTIPARNGPLTRAGGQSEVEAINER